MGKSGWRIARYGNCKRRNVDCLIARTGRREIEILKADVAF